MDLDSDSSASTDLYSEEEDTVRELNTGRLRYKRVHALHVSAPSHLPGSKKKSSLSTNKCSKVAIIGRAGHRASTPLSLTLSSLGQHIPRRRERIDVFLKREIQQCRVIPFEAFAEHILHVTPSEISKMRQLFAEASLDSFPWVKHARAEWQKSLFDPNVKETDRYVPFSNLANTIISVLRELGYVQEEQVQVVFCRNDPRDISTKFNPRYSDDDPNSPARRPDVTQVTDKVAAKIATADPPSQTLIDQIEATLANPPSFLPIKSRRHGKKTGRRASTGTAGQRVPSLNLSADPPTCDKARTAPNSPTTPNQPSPGAPRAEFCISIGPNFTLEWNQTLCCWEFKVHGQTAILLRCASPLDRPFLRYKFPEHDENEMVDISAPAEGDALRRDGTLQLASYALEALSHRGLRRHVINALVEDEMIILWYFDRGGVFVADPIPMNDLGRLAVVLFGMARLTPYEWGYYQSIGFPSIREVSRIPRSLVGTTISLDVGTQPVVFRLGRQIYGENVITGRGTTIAHVTIAPECPRFTQQALVVKYGWPVVSRQSEVTILHHIRDQLLGSPDEYLLNHLPRIYAARDYDRLSDGPRAALYKQYGRAFNKQDDRVLRVIIMDQLFPVTELSPKHFMTAYRDALHCADRLHTLMGTLHRDISLMNLMYRKVKINGIQRIVGVLNDWDLAFCPKLQITPSPTSRQRSGTLPYCSLGRLHHPPEPSKFGHDLESFFWTLLIAATCIARCDVQKGPRTIVNWFKEGDPTTLRAVKKVFLDDVMFREFKRVQYKKEWDSIGRLVQRWGWKLAYAIYKSNRSTAKKSKSMKKPSKKNPTEHHSTMKTFDATVRYKSITRILDAGEFGKYHPHLSLCMELGY